MSAIDVPECPIRGWHDEFGHPRSFSTKPSLIHHLNNGTHTSLFAQIDHSIYKKEGVYPCTHPRCATSRCWVFASRASLDQHNRQAHPPLCTNTPRPVQPTITTGNEYTFVPPPSHQTPGESVPRVPLAASPLALRLCKLYIVGRTKDAQDHDWAAGLQETQRYQHHQPPDFRTTWHRFLSNRTRPMFTSVMVDVLQAICLALHNYKPNGSSPIPNHNYL